MKKSACFTGHRELSGDINDLKNRLYNIIERGINNLGLTDFYAGGAIGWDTLAALTVLQLKKIYPHIRLHLILPCSNKEQTTKWNEEQRKEFYSILSSADTVEYVSQKYYNGCMKDRNARLVDNTNTLCLCYFNPKKSSSGTEQTIRMAQAKHIMIVNFFK